MRIVRMVAALLLGCGGLAAQDELIRLTGWKEKVGDSAEWASVEFDDSGWRDVTAPLAIGARGFGQTNIPPVTWYRKRFAIPEGWTGHALAIGLLKLDDAYEVFAGGEKIGVFGAVPPAGSEVDHSRVVAPYNRRMAFRIPMGACRNGAVVLAIRRWRLPVTNSPESVYIQPLPTAPPVIGLAPLVFSQHRALQYANYIEGLPGILSWLITLGCAIGCLRLRRDTEHRELLWAGLALLISGLRWGVGFPITLAEWPAKNSMFDFAQSFTSRFGTALFFGWFLAELVPEWRRRFRWLSVATAIVYTFDSWHFHFGFPPWAWAVGGRWLSLAAHCAMSTLAAWQVWRTGRAELLGPVLAVAVRAVILGVTLSWNAANFYGAGPLQFSLRRTADAAIAVGIAGVLYARARRERARQQEIDRDMQAAQRIQEILLGGAEVATPGFAVEPVYLPAKEVGGDFYQAIPGDDGSLLVLVGDVSGKGLQAAMLVSSVIGALRNETSRAPGEVLAHLNRSLLGRTGGGFVTCCCARFDADGMVTVANAGHLAPYAGGHEVGGVSGLPLGVAAGVEFEELRAPMKEPFVLMSDGVAEAANAAGELFGFERTAGMALRPAKEIAEAARAWGQTDDITVVTVRRVG